MVGGGSFSCKKLTILVGRVMKLALPPHGKLSKESKVCIQECVSEFISFVTSQAVDKCKIEKRKTLNGEDILWAMYTLGFENYSETLKIYLAKYREFEQQEAEKKPQRRRRKRPDEEKFDYESDFLSEDISPTNSDGNPDYLKINELTNGLNPNFTFNDNNLTEFNMSQRPSVNNYLLLPSSNANSRRQSRNNDINNFEEFVERMD